MAQKPTNVLPLTVIQPRAVPEPMSGDLLPWAKKIHGYLQTQRTMIQTMYNSVVKSQSSLSLVGLAADLPSPGTPGRVFVATDTKIVYFDTGSVWLQVTAT